MRPVFALLVPLLAFVPRALVAASPAGAEAGPVVVELFTSQGCSSCPPADRLLTALARESDGRMIPLAYHVDSWNHAGWTDPFSSAEWTRRHAFYARTLRAEGAYTPQAVVNGAVELLGSDRESLAAAVATAARRPSGRLVLEIDPPAGKAKALSLAVRVELPPELRDRRHDLMVALVETGLVTPVKRGENGGRTLENDNVVRTLKRATRLEPGAAGDGRYTAELRLVSGWDRSRLAVVAFLQDPKTLEIRGATSAGVPAPES